MNCFDEEQAYWQRVQQQREQEQATLVQDLREETERLRKRCHDLELGRCMSRAEVAYDIREYCMQHANRSGDVPLSTLLDYLHTYSDELVPGGNREAKRTRRTVPAATAVREREDDDKDQDSEEDACEREMVDDDALRHARRARADVISADGERVPRVLRRAPVINQTPAPKSSPTKTPSPAGNGTNASPEAAGSAVSAPEVTTSVTASQSPKQPVKGAVPFQRYEFHKRPLFQMLQSGMKRVRDANEDTERHQGPELLFIP